MNALALRVDGISKAYTTRHNHPIDALRSVSFDVARGQVVGVIGRNGAGKSTLLRILGRITLPSAGTVSVWGRLGALLEMGAGFHPDLSGIENVYLYGAVLGLRRAVIGRRLDDILEISGVRAAAREPLRTYSAGMKARLSFSTAMLLDVGVLLLDEIFTVGDLEFRRRCRDWIRERSASGCTVVLVSHSMAIVTSVCDRVIWLDRGEVRGEGTADAVCDAYRRAALVLPDTPPGGPMPLVRSSSSGALRIASVTCSPSDAAQATLTCGASCAITIDYSSELPPGTPLVANLVVRGEESERVAALASDVRGAALATADGSGRIVCLLPRLPLLPGSYSLRATLRTHGGDECRADTAHDLTVAAGDYYGSGQLPTRAQGQLLIDHDWIACSHASEGR